MDAQLEIICKQGNDCKGSPWKESLGIPFQSIMNKLRELTKPENDDWDVPFDRIRMCHNDFQRCGSQGDVFYGKLSNTPVAVKRVKDVSLAQIKHLRELNHKNVVKFRGVSQNSSYSYIIMEWCPYGTLHDHIHSGRQLSSKILSDFAQQVASGMKYLHSKDIIHRDLKPSNILLTHHDVLKISDFGTHKVFSDKQPITSITWTGTQAYMAPEVIRSDQFSFPVDVWSYGVVLWEILIGDEPYKGLDSTTVVWAVGNNSFHLPLPSTFPDGFRRIVSGCWKAEPSDRLTFPQIVMTLKGAINDVDKISKERWLPLQAEWKREVREDLKKQFQSQTDLNEDSSCRQKREALDEAIEQAQKRWNKNNLLYLKLQECCMHLQQERKEVEKRKELVSKREEAVAQLETDITEKDHEINRLREKLSRINEELNRRNLKLDCLQEINLHRHGDDSDANNDFNNTSLSDKEINVIS